MSYYYCKRTFVTTLENIRFKVNIKRTYSMLKGHSNRRQATAENLQLTNRLIKIKHFVSYFQMTEQFCLSLNLKKLKDAT